MLHKEKYLVESIGAMANDIADIVQALSKRRGGDWSKIRKKLTEASNEMQFSIEPTMARPSINGSDVYWTTTDAPGVACHCPNCLGDIGRYVHFGGFQP